MNAPNHPLRTIVQVLAIASAGLALLSGAAASAARGSGAAAERTEAAPQTLVFGQGTWNGSGKRHELFTDGPYPLEIDTNISFKLKIAANGAASGTFRQEGTSTPKGNGWAGQMKHVITGKLTGRSDDNVFIVGEISTAGTITYRDKGIPQASTKPYRAHLGPTSAGCNLVRSKYWSAKRVPGTGKTPAAATIRKAEANTLQALQAALAVGPYPLARDTLRTVTGWLYQLNLQVERARTCGAAPAGYSRGLSGRSDVATLLRDLVKRLVALGRPYSALGYEPYDAIALVNSSVDAGLVGIDPTVRQGLEGWLDQALTDRIGKAGAEGVVDDIERAARRAGMTSVAERAAKG